MENKQTSQILNILSESPSGLQMEDLAEKQGLIRHTIAKYLDKNIIYIAGIPDLRAALQEQLDSNQDARYFIYEHDPMYTKHESELIQQFLQKHGHLPPGNEEIDDLF